MFSNIKVIIEFISLLLSTYRFLAGEISEAKYFRAIKKRKEARDKYLEANNISDRLDALRDLEK